jgi:hypothetical protein
VNPDGPADRAGLAHRDEIEAVDETPVAGKTYEQVVKMIRGEPGTTVKLTVKGEKGAREVSVTRVAADHLPMGPKGSHGSQASRSHATHGDHLIPLRGNRSRISYLSQEENWTAVEHLYLNLAYRDSENLVDPPGGLARMAKEMIQTSVRQQSDVSSAMAARLDKTESDRLWVEQAGWRRTNEKTWW